MKLYMLCRRGRLSEEVGDGALPFSFCAVVFCRPADVFLRPGAGSDSESRATQIEGSCGTPPLLVRSSSLDELENMEKVLQSSESTWAEAGALRVGFFAGFLFSAGCGSAPTAPSAGRPLCLLDGRTRVAIACVSSAFFCRRRQTQKMMRATAMNTTTAPAITPIDHRGKSVDFLVDEFVGIFVVVVFLVELVEL